MISTGNGSDNPITQRSIQCCDVSVRVDEVSEALGTEETLRSWLEQTAAEQGTRWLHGYDDDGVLWGRFDAEGTLVTAREAVRRCKGRRAAKRFAQLRPVTLQEVSLFGREREVKLWRDDTDTWRVRYITEPAFGGDGDHKHYFDESHLLIGTYAETIGDDFTLVWEGRKQRRHLHAVPASLPLNGDSTRIEERPRLRVRTYLTDGPWHTPSLQRHAGLVDARGDDLNAPEGPVASSHS